MLRYDLVKVTVYKSVVGYNLRKYISFIEVKQAGLFCYMPFCLLIIIYKLILISIV